MNKFSRRGFLGASAATLATSAFVGRSSVALAEDAPSGGSVSGEILSMADAPWTSAKVLHTGKLPWIDDKTWAMKMLYENDISGAHLMLLDVPPGWTGGELHYHLFHEWAYIMSGDLTNNDYSSVEQKVGYMQQFREGDWLDRPAFGLHGDEQGRRMSQIGCRLIIMEEGPTTLSPLKRSPWYSEDYKNVREWTRPRIVNTIAEMLWEEEGSVDGLMIKRLADDPARGFRANLFWLPAGWDSDRSQEFSKPYYYDEALELNLVLVGDMTIQPYQAPGKKAEAISLGRDSYFERGAKCLAGLADGVVTEKGCVWLQVTYGNGKEAKVSDHPIGDQKHA